MPPDAINLLLGADSLLDMRSGVGRMTFEIAREIAGRADIADYGFLVEGGIRPPKWIGSVLAAESRERSKRTNLAKTAKAAVGRVPLIRKLRNQIRRAQLNSAVRAFAKQNTSMLYHEPNMITAPYDGPTVSTFNDLSWHWDPTIHPPDRVRWIHANLPRVLAETTRFVAISDFTAREVVKEFGIPRNRIDVIPLAPAAEFRPLPASAAVHILDRYGLKDQSYVFSVSTLEPRKNFDRLLDAYLGLPAAIRARAPLVIAGGKGWGDVLHRADRALAAGELKLLGHISDEDLVVLTARCGVFGYVSLYEGFGLPVVEAMATGVAVIASSTTATGETAGSGALLVNPLDEVEIRAGILAILQDRELRESWQRAGFRRSEDFSWQSTIDRLMVSWRMALGYEQPVARALMTPLPIAS